MKDTVQIQKGADPTIPGWMHPTAFDRAKEQKNEAKKICKPPTDRAPNPLKYKFKTCHPVVSDARRFAALASLPERWIRSHP